MGGEQRSGIGLPHGVHVLGLDLVEHALFARLSVGIFVLPQILLCHLVDVLGCALLCYLVYPSANPKIAIRVVRIDDGDGDSGIALHVAVFLPPDRRVHPDVAVLVVHPNRRGVWAAVGQ